MGRVGAQRLLYAATFQEKENVMNSIPSVFRVLGVALILLALGAFGATPASQAQITAPAAPAASTAQSSFCGSQPLCYEANDFAATITDFRTSTQGGYKVIDVIVRFQNKLNQPLALGYLASSGTALDDRGNRYIVYGGNGFRGIGQVYGNNFDPKFSLRPGGYGDAQFELMWAPGQTVYGLTFELNLTVDEINTVEGNQHTLGGEFPLHYRGLANGVTAGAPGQATAFASQGQGQGTASSIPGLPPCGTTATTLAGAANSSGVQVPASANTAVSNATTAFSNLGSLFGKKKAAAPAAPAAPTTSNTTSAAPCTPAPTGAGTTSATTMTSGTTSMSAANGTATQPAGTASSTNAAPAPVAKAATTRTTTTTTTTTATTAKPVPVVTKTPAPQSNATVKKAVATPAPQKPAATTTAAQKPAPTNQ
jgi:hypothetical protein